MSISSRPARIPSPMPVRWAGLLLLIMLATGLGLAAAEAHLLLLLAAGLAIPAALVLLRWPDAATLAVVFLLYTNAPVVAVKFHGLPFLLGASVPLLLMLPLAYSLTFLRQPVIITPAFPLLLLYLVAQAISTYFSADVTRSFAALQVFLIEGVILYFMITNAVRTPAMLRRVTWALLLAGSLMGALSFYQQITHQYNHSFGGFAQISQGAFRTGEITLQGEVTQPRLAGPIGEENRLAQILLMLIPLGLFRFWGERALLLRLLALGMTGLTAIGMALTFSRGGAVAFLLLLFTMAFMRLIRIQQLLLALLIGVGVLLAVPQFKARLVTLQELTQVLETDSAGIAAADASTRSRVTEMLAAVKAFIDHPLVGVGPGMFGQHYETYAKAIGIRIKYGQARRPHSLLPDIAAETGLLGLLCFLAITFVTLRDLHRARHAVASTRPDLVPLLIGYLLAILGYLFSGLFLHFAYIRYFWLMMALAGAAGQIGRTWAVLPGRTPSQCEVQA